VKVQGKLNMHIIFQNVLMLLYQHYCMIVETTACQSWLIF